MAYKSGKNEELQLVQISQNTDQCHIREHMEKIPMKSWSQLIKKQKQLQGTQIAKIQNVKI